MNYQNNYKNHNISHKSKFSLIHLHIQRTFNNTSKSLCLQENPASSTDSGSGGRQWANHRTILSTVELTQHQMSSERNLAMCNLMIESLCDYWKFITLGNHFIWRKKHWWWLQQILKVFMLGCFGTISVLRTQFFCSRQQKKIKWSHAIPMPWFYYADPILWDEDM